MSGEIFWKVLGLIFLVSAASHADELDGLITLAYSNSPTLQAAREGTRQAEAAHDATAEFFDPHTTATAGRMSGNNTPPILPRSGHLWSFSGSGSAVSTGDLCRGWRR